MAIATALPGFNDLELSDSQISTFLLMDHFLYHFSMFIVKNEENLTIRSLNLFCKIHHQSLLL